MNYSKTIREYCLKNPGMVFDMSYERKNHFEMVPYKTFCKILSRLEEGILKTYSKGVYLINSDKEAEDPIIAFYANDCSDMVVGYKMYNDLGVVL
jgi:predicted transcriptional regulator of viral defense system